MFEKKARTHVKYSYMPKWSLTYHTYNMDKDTLWWMNHNLFYSRRKNFNKTPLNKQKTTNHKLRNSWACQRKCTSLEQANCILDFRWNFQYDSIHLEGNRFNTIYLEIILSLERLNSFISKNFFVYHCSTSDWFQIYYQALIRLIVDTFFYNVFLLHK